MADRVASIAVELLIQRLEQDADLLHDMQDVMRKFQATLRQVSSFFTEFQVKLNGPDAMALVRQINDKAYEAEDVIDTFIIKNEQKRIRSKLQKLFHVCGSRSLLRDASSKIEDINCKMTRICRPTTDEILVKHCAVDGDSYSGGRWTAEELADVVGFDEVARKLVKRLTHGRTRRVVAITGLEGSGKTTLAQKIFDHDSVKAGFKHRAWVRVSEQYGVEELLRSILTNIRSTATGWGSQLNVEEFKTNPNEMEGNSHQPEKVELKTPLHTPKPSEDMPLAMIEEMSKPSGEEFRFPTEEEIPLLNEEELKEKLRTFFRHKRYLIVMDDVCGKEVWDELRPAFPDDSVGSKILFTSRLNDVTDRRDSYELRGLGEEDSWKLLSKKAFRDQICPRELEDDGKRLAGKCSGNPRALVVMGEILARKGKNPRTWSDFVDNASRDMHLSGPRIVCRYDDMPFPMRNCFMYFGMFPENHEISARQLIQLWMAEDFIAEKEDKKMEDIGEEYLKEFIDRNYVQVTGRRSDGGVKKCRVPFLLRDFCITKASEQQFFEVNSANKSSETQIETPRLAIHGDSPSKLRNYSRLRSLHCMSPGKNWKSFLHTTDIKSLRVLNLGSVTLHGVPDVVGKLIHLKYLKINVRNFVNWPHTLSNIRNLQTLDMRESTLMSAPDGIWKMQNLRHLYFHSIFPRNVSDPEGHSFLEPLKKLQTLSGIRPHKVLKRLMVKSKFPNATKLGLDSRDRRETLEFLESLDHLYYLRSLRIKGSSKLPDPHAFPVSLTKMTLSGTELGSECLKTLEKLPNLQILKLLHKSVAEEEQISFSEGAFAQLEVLYFVDLNIKAWKLERGAVRSLQVLKIRNCAGLAFLPHESLAESALYDLRVEIFGQSAIPEYTLQRLTESRFKVVRW